MTKTKYYMVIGLLMLTALSFIGSPFIPYLPLQHIPTVLTLVVFLGLSGKYPLSNTSFACIMIFLLFHTLGARYVYSNVPYDEWSKALIGTTISEIFGWTRNHYDRFVHFAYGCLLYVPAREAFNRFMHIPKKYAGYLAIGFVIASGAIYEVLEWLVAIVFAKDQADVYNGQQGDMWDSQKDMLMALIGVLLVAFGSGLFQTRGRRCRYTESETMLP